MPGYVTAWLLDLFGFRRRTLLFRIAASLPLSISLCPILIYLAGPWPIFASWAAGAILAVAGLRRLSIPRVPWPVAAMAAGWMALAMISLADLQLGNRLYYSTIGLDYSIRSAMIHSLATFGIPAQSPFFFPGHPITLRYHYFWLMLCALVKKLGGGVISGRQALIAGTPWCGIGLMGIIALYLRLFSAEGPSNLRRRLTAGVALLGVTGLDLLPTIPLLVLYASGTAGMIFPSVEWWNEQVDGWTYTMLWEPHHLAGLIACLTGFLLLWRAAEEESRRGLLKHSLAAGVAFATAVGSSIHVTFVFAIFLLVWGTITLWKQWRKDTWALIAAGLIAAVAGLPYLRSILGPGAGGPPLEWTVRKFMIPEYFMKAVGLRSPWQLALGNLLLLPLNYFLELGVFFVAGWLWWKSVRAKPMGRRVAALSAMGGVSIIICTFLRSSLIGNNDLGWRGFLPAQFVLLLLAADLFGRWPDVPRRRLLVTLIVIGATGTVYDVIILRVYPLLSDRGSVRFLDWMARDRDLGRRTYDVRAAYEWAQRHAPASAVVQHNPDVSYQDTAAGLYADRRTAAFDMECGATFGGDPHECAPVSTSLKVLYSAGANDQSLQDVCARLPVDILVAKDTDPAWKNGQSWIWNHEPIFANTHVRLFGCRGRPALSRLPGSASGPHP